MPNIFTIDSDGNEVEWTEKDFANMGLKVKPSDIARFTLLDPEERSHTSSHSYVIFYNFIRQDGSTGINKGEFIQPHPIQTVAELRNIERDTAEMEDYASVFIYNIVKLPF